MTNDPTADGQQREKCTIPGKIRFGKNSHSSQSMNKSQSQPLRIRRERRAARILVLFSLSFLFVACAGVRGPGVTETATADSSPSGVRECPPCPKCPGEKEVLPSQPPAQPLQAARWEELPGWNEDDPGAAWPALLQSCRALAKKDAWRDVCAAAQAIRMAPTGGDENAVSGIGAAEARRFFETHFVPYRAVQPDGATQGLITGYYEPLLNGARQRGGAYQYPVLGVPGDLLTIDLGEVVPSLKGKRLRGRLSGNKVVPYWSRAEIVAHESDARQFTPLFWVDDPIALFFLQIQGSGRIRLPSGEMARVNYADQNGHPYHSIGRLLVERGELTLEEASMQGIRQWATKWAETRPEKVSELLNANPSYVFFRELKAQGGGRERGEEGPPGALGVPLTAGRSIAVDPQNVPLGAPVFIDTSWPNRSEPLRRLMLAQDTGGAIKGVVRADFFWGFGVDAGALAGKMRQPLQMWVLLPVGMSPAGAVPE